jgi:hypothetical protein
MAHDQWTLDAALAEASVKIPADRPLIKPVDRWLRGADARQVVGKRVAVRGEQWCHVPPRVQGLRPPVQQDQRDRPAAMLDQAEPPG